eukprot:3996368-Prymnesium_polylepis.1
MPAELTAPAARARCVRGRRLMGIGEWMMLLGDLSMLDAQFSQREATYAFMWSRMRTADEADRRRLCNLTYVDFLEARAHAP